MKRSEKTPAEIGERAAERENLLLDRLDHAREHYDEAILRAARVLRDAADRLVAEYRSDRVGQHATPMQVGAWAIGHLTTYVPGNIRVDIIATAAADLAAAQRAVEGR